MPDVEGMTEQLAVQAIHEAGLEELPRREPDADVKGGTVFEQDPQPGDRIERGNFVTIVVSTGPKKVQVPNVVGKSRDDAVSDARGRQAAAQRRRGQLARAREHRARARRRRRGPR